MTRIYLDYAASTPVLPEVEAAMRPYFLKKFGNAGSLHSFGQEAIRALDESRETIARTIGADFSEVIFTGSATEANNIALRGAMRRFTQISTQINADKKNNIRENPRAIRDNPRPRLIVSAIEHESVLETARDLEKGGVEVVYLPVSKGGIVDLKKLKEVLNERTILVSVMYANNEIGTIQPISEIAKIVNDFRKNNHYPLFHTDAVQAFQFLDCDVNAPAGGLGADLMTLSAHKIYGPKGVGALYIGSRVQRIAYSNEKNSLHPTPYPLYPIITGGGQEFGLRSGTENIALIVGFAKAAELVMRSRAREPKRIAALRDYLWKGIRKIYPAAERNGDARNVLPNFLNVYFPDYKAEDLLTRFDLAGLAVSAGSACTARSTEPSYVIEALGAGAKQSSQSIRFTLGKPTSKKDIDITLKIIGKLLNK